MEADFFPLDQELQVPDGHLLPHAQETLVSLGSELPFGRAVKHLERTLGVVVHASTARRQTLAVGQRVLEVQNKQAQPWRLSRGASRGADGDEQRREHGAVSGRSVGRGQGGGDWRG